MKKHVKLTAVLSTAAVMAAFVPAFTSTALAKSTGWTQEGEDWKYYDSDGYYLTDSWKKQDKDWFYLDEDGNISFNSQIDEYYVGADGKRVSNQWVSVENEDYDGSDDEPEFYWFYYSHDGKFLNSRFKKIDDKTYYFDSEGHMLTGLQEIDGATYYFGNEKDGVMQTGWVDLTDYADDNDDETVWSYFNGDGQRIENQVDKKIGTSFYTFENGKMVTGWYQLPAQASVEATPEAESENADGVQEAEGENVDGAQEAEDNTNTEAENSDAAQNPVARYQYYNEDGTRASGWKNITGIPGISQEDEIYRFYFKSGKPYFAETGLQIFRINAERYCFNAKGEMQTGLQNITLEDGAAYNFYFDENGIMKVGKQNIYDEDSGITQTWFFETDNEKRGQGYHGIRDNIIYENGLRKQADSHMRYAPVTFEGQNYLVNASGSIQKASASSKSSERPELGAGYRDLKDAYENIWTVDTNGVIQ